MRNFIARLLARFIVCRRYVTAAEIHKAIAEHNEAMRAASLCMTWRHSSRPPATRPSSVIWRRSTAWTTTRSNAHWWCAVK